MDLGQAILNCLFDSIQNILHHIIGMIRALMKVSLTGLAKMLALAILNCVFDLFQNV
jgi:hypothetical protein